jgi:dTMP kinase
MGKLIVIEGLDGSGKATQTALLEEYCRSLGLPVRKVSFPDYDSDSSAPVRMYLRGDFGSRPEDVNAYAASAFYAVDRCASYLRDWRRDYAAGLVLADRYTSSNAIHQCAKLPREEWGPYLDWLFDFEFGKLGIPAPDLTVYLRVDPAVSQRLLTARYGGREERKDIHEKDRAYLARCRLSADYCAEVLGWQVVECCRDGAMLGVEEIGEIVKGVVRSHLP